MNSLDHLVEGIRYSPEEVGERVRAIYAATLRESRFIRTGNFEGIVPEDVERLFWAYDDAFFDGLFRQLLSRGGEGPLSFAISRTMTSAGGKTKRWQQRAARAPGSHARNLYELAVSATLLFQTFRGEERAIVVAGIECLDRLEALQRIVEHEMIHLLELLVWQRSSCARERFQRLAGSLFAHTARHHQLVTPREIAHEQGIWVGAMVTFEYRGIQQTGRVNQIRKRVTVLVEHPEGELYSDGRRYHKFYVPLALLRLAG